MHQGQAIIALDIMLLQREINQIGNETPEVEKAVPCSGPYVDRCRFRENVPVGGGSICSKLLVHAKENYDDWQGITGQHYHYRPCY